MNLLQATLDDRNDCYDYVQFSKSENRHIEAPGPVTGQMKCPSNSSAIPCIAGCVLRDWRHPHTPWPLYGYLLVVLTWIDAT